MTNKNYLTTDAYVEMAENVMNVAEDLRIIESTLQLIQSPSGIKETADMAIEYYKVYQYIDSLFPKVQGLIKSLEYVSGALYTTDELDELKGYVDDKWLISEEKKIFKSFDEFKNDPERTGVTGAELKHYQNMGYSMDEILIKVCTIDSETGRIEKEFPQTTNNK